MPEIIRVNREWIKRQIDSARVSIGRNVSFYTTSRTGCTLCLASGYYNATLDSTFYTTCPICAGNFYTDAVTQHVILARVHWTNDEAATATPGGKYYMGDATVTIDPSYLSVAEAAQNQTGRVVVDGHDMQITKIIPKGAPEPNRYQVVLKNMGERPQ